MGRRAPGVLIPLVLIVVHACGNDRAHGAGAGGKAGSAGTAGSGGDAVVERPMDPTCESIEAGSPAPVGACVAGAVCEGYTWVFCPDGYDPHFGAQWKCTCAPGGWICQHPTGALTFPDCTGHTTPEGGGGGDGGGAD